MYLQIKVDQDDHRFLRFLWRELENRPPDVYEFNRVVFGLCSSPFLAQFVTQEHARQHADEFPRAAESVLESTYMDDTLDSVSTVCDGVQLYKDLLALWSGAGMTARKWLSNSPEVLEAIPVESRAKEINLQTHEFPAVKALGLLWKADDDCFSFQPNLGISKITTKRQALQVVSRVFDPLGFVTPVMICGRILLQQVWLQGTDWDELLPAAVSDSLTDWLSQLDQLAGVHIPRCLCTGAEATESEVHVFCDASQDAYGAVAYFRTVDAPGDVTVRLISSRVRVAPVKAVSIPRLELMAASIGAALATTTTCTLKTSQAILWTDSLNVLFWLRNQSRSFKPFIANRVGEIHRTTDPSQWRHVPSLDNPADLLSRGLSAKDLVESQFWWTGPAFLRQDSSSWPARHLEPVIPPASELRTPRQTTTLLTTACSTEPSPWQLDPSRFSSWSQLLRRTALVLRFVHNCRQKASALRLNGALSVEELGDAECLLLSRYQAASFPEYDALKCGKTSPPSSKLAGLSPFLDEDGVMRMAWPT